MARQTGTELPPELLERFHPAAIEPHANQVVLMVTRDADGWPRPAMLSHFEIVAHGPEELRLAIYGDSTAAANLRRDGTLTLVVVDAGTVYYIKGSAHQLRPALNVLPHSALMGVRVVQVLADHADPDREGEVMITSGITFASSRLGETLAAAETVFDEMLAGPEGHAGS